MLSLANFPLPISTPYEPHRFCRDCKHCIDAYDSAFMVTGVMIAASPKIEDGP